MLSFSSFGVGPFLFLLSLFYQFNYLSFSFTILAPFSFYTLSCVMKLNLILHVSNIIKRKKRKRKRDKVKNQASDYLFWVGGGTATYFISLFVFIILFNLWNAYISLYKVYLCIICCSILIFMLLRNCLRLLGLSHKEFSWLSVFCTDYINGVYDIFV